MKQLIIQCAGLGYDITCNYSDLCAITELDFHPITPVFPAVTCTAQATIRTAAHPKDHGIVCNGYYDRLIAKTNFWCQSARLVQGKRIWENSKSQKTAMIFFQQNLGENVDIVISPAPIHKHHGGMIMGCHTKPHDLENELNEAIGQKLNLASYWGPMASSKSSEWIAKAIIHIAKNHKPDLFFAYLPHLDYCQQKFGPDDTKRIEPEVKFLAEKIRDILDAVKDKYQVTIWGDYAITPANQPIFPNKALKKAGLFKTRSVGKGMTYPNFYESDAFAMVDHQVAHIFVENADFIPQVRQLISDLDGVDSVLTRQEADMDCPQAGELIATAKPSAWFAYHWWDDPKQAPDYATHIDIHNKIGFDPCELFWGFPPFVSISTDCSKPKGTHGRDDQPAAFATTIPTSTDCLPKSHLELAQFIQKAIQ
ncbi:MAG: alkaline phosphatase family protein [Lentisphaerae bacterium]|nr:alkaline phosphatase family protein [Lentisphaerota bacterium]